MNAFEAALALFVAALVIFVVLAALVAVVLFIAVTAYALVKPYISELIDAYIDWYERRTL